eukprot:TRINITY_DN22565_c0_g1_i1.p1 TRINITY_DN22565_c0_g1~~TRINITY_DN22565_c0_g1_i1.p1  ORF type:complete len:268 (+),score=122.51 TRINITY_DN22565_c0_g1_i1:76-879(+)
MAEVKGMSAALQQAEAGLKLFQAEEQLELDVPAAETYKAEMEQRIAGLEAEAAKLTGKDNKKERAAKGKEVAELKGEARYVDACKVCKGLEPKNGNFVVGGMKKKEETKPAAPPTEAPPAAPAPAKKESKKAKKDEAGLSPAEEKELEDLKQKIIDRKTQLKAEGLSGGQQNKDAQIVEWVTRMNELKEKQDPGSTEEKKKDGGKKKGSKAPLSSEEQKMLSQLEQEVEVYKQRLRTEFGYSKKEAAADPDLQEMEAKLKEFQKRSS